MTTDDKIYKDLEAMSPEERYSLFTHFLKDHPGDAWGWARLGYEAEDLGRIEDAKRYLERSIFLERRSEFAASVYFNLALLLAEKLKDPINARLNYLNALCANPDYDRPYNNLGLLLQNAFDEIELAKHYFNEGISRCPKDATLHNNLGYLYVEYLNDEGRAAIHWKIALELDPENEDLLFNLDSLKESE